jgi:DNA-binding IclR family transcriptional regulator
VMQELDPSRDGNGGRRGPQSVHRVLAILSALGTRGPTASLSELADQVALPASTAFRLLNALVDTGFATQDPVTKRYSLGSAVTTLVSRFGNPYSLRMIARPCLEELRAKLGETVFVSILADHEIEYLDVLVSERSVRMVGVPGQLGPLHASSQGKAILANLPADRREQLIQRLELTPYTKNTIVDADQLRQELATVRQRGYSIGDQEHEDGVRAVSAPVFDLAGHPVAAVCVAAPSYRASLAKLRKVFAPEVITTAEEISRRVRATDGLVIR